METNRKPTIIIIGAGLAGLSMALSIVRNLAGRFNVEVIEKRKDAFDRNGSAYGLAPNGQKAMEEISPEVLEYCRGVRIVLSTGGWLMPWFEIRNALLRECENQTDDAITIRRGLEVNKIEQTESSVVASFANSDLILEGSLLIGADGVHSTIRSLIGLDGAKDSGAHVWRGCVDTLKQSSMLRDVAFPQTLPGMFFSRVGQSQVSLFDFRETRPGIVAWVISTSNPDIPIVPGETTPLDILEQESSAGEIPADVVERIRQMLAESDERDLNRTASLCVTPLPEPAEDSPMWCCKGRIVLVGDAAHAVRPASGLGGALAFEDVAILTRLLKDVQQEEQEGAVPTVLQRFADKRLPRLKSISDDQTRISEGSYKKEKVKPWTEEYKEWVFMGPDAPSYPPTEA